MKRQPQLPRWELDEDDIYVNLSFSRTELPTRGDYVFIGQAPSKSGDRFKAFSKCSGTSQKIANLLKLDHNILFTELAWAVNLFARWTGYAHNNGDKFILSHAKKQATDVMRMLAGCYLVLLGKNVAAAFEQKEKPFFLWFPFNMAQAAVIPHPSGVNRWWNDKNNLAQAQQFFSVLHLRIVHHARTKESRNTIRLPSRLHCNARC